MKLYLKKHLINNLSKYINYIIKYFSTVNFLFNFKLISSKQKILNIYKRFLVINNLKKHD